MEKDAFACVRRDKSPVPIVKFTYSTKFARDNRITKPLALSDQNIFRNVSFVPILLQKSVETGREP
jgi:hypothetical protein